MKTIFSIMACSLFAVSAYSQSVRVTFNGNKDFQLIIDGVNYNSTNYTNNDVVLYNLSGNHTIAVNRVNKKGKSKQVYTSTVSLSPNEEVHLTVNKNGSITREETSSNAAYGSHSPMTDLNFSTVIRNVSNQRTQSAKMSTARDVFNTSGYYFSSYQVRRIIELLSSEANRLELAKLAYGNVTDPLNFSQVEDLLRNQSSRTELDNYIRDYNYGDPYNSYKIAMSSAAFDQLYRDINNQWGTSAKMSTATNAFNVSTKYFTVAQAKQIIELISDENSRLQLAKLSLDNVVDLQNLSQLFDLFYYQSSKDELDTYIRSNGYAGSDYSYNYNKAMTDDVFNTLYNDIRSQWWPGSKMSSAVDAFNTPSNYFTTAQAKQIIGLVSAESNRVELAKLSFDNIVDPQSFRQIYDLFSSQSSKDEVDNYIRVKYNYQ